MLKGYSLKNFKAFGDSDQIVRLAPLTLVFGPNSSGKSAFLQSLTMLKKAISGDTPNKPIHLSVDDGYHDHGSLRNLFFKHDYALNQEFECHFSGNGIGLKKIGFTFGLKKTKKIELQSLIYGYGKQLHVELEPNERQDVQTQVYLYQEKKHPDSDPLLTLEKLAFFAKAPGFLPLCINSQDPMDVDPDMLLPEWVKKTPYFPIVEEITTAFAKLSFIGPQRYEPQRVYKPKEDQQNTVGFAGQNWAQVVHESNDGGIDLGLDQWLKNLGLPYKVQVKRFGDLTSGFFLGYKLTDTNLEIELSLQDVGYGVSQVLPILVEGLHKNDSIILVEQPELHLHPKMQADMADFFVENAKKNNNQWIIETHSELLILRTLRKIRQGVISPEDVSVLYVNPSKEGANIQELRINEVGDFIDPWPHGFFDEDIIELFGGDEE